MPHPELRMTSPANTPLDPPEEVQAEHRDLEADEQMVEDTLAELNRTDDAVLAELAYQEAQNPETDVTAIYGPHHGGGLQYGYSLHAFRYLFGKALVVATPGNCGDRYVYTGTVRDVFGQIRTLVQNGWSIESNEFALRIDDES